MFEGFTRELINTEEATDRVRHGETDHRSDPGRLSAEPADVAPNCPGAR